MNLKKWLAPALLLLLVAVMGWIFLRPQPTDEEQIRAVIADVESAVSRKSTGAVLDAMSDDFKWNGQTKKELRAQLLGGLLQFKKVDLQTSNVQVKIEGERATTTGRFDLTLQRDENGPAETRGGDFQLSWRKENGEWKVIEAQGVPDLVPGG